MTDETKMIREEIASLFEENKVDPSEFFSTKLPAEEFNQIHTLAIRILQGYVNQNEISTLNTNQRNELSHLVSYLIGLRQDGTLKKLQEINRYFDAFPSLIVRDEWSAESVEEEE